MLVLQYSRLQPSQFQPVTSRFQLVRSRKSGHYLDCYAGKWRNDTESGHNSETEKGFETAEVWSFHTVSAARRMRGVFLRLRRVRRLKAALLAALRAPLLGRSIVEKSSFCLRTKKYKFFSSSARCFIERSVSFCFLSRKIFDNNKHFDVKIGFQEFQLFKDLGCTRALAIHQGTEFSRKALHFHPSGKFHADIVQNNYRRKLYSHVDIFLNFNIQLYAFFR